MSELDLAAIKARAEMATAGPWTPESRPWTGPDFPGEHHVVTSTENPRYPVVALTGLWLGELNYQSSADKRFIAAAREDVPALLAEVERLAGECDGFRESLLPRPSGPPRPLPRPKTFHIGKPPQLPLAIRRARLLTHLGRYAIAWGVVGVGCYWMSLGSTGVGLAVLAVAGFICGPRPIRVPRH